MSIPARAAAAVVAISATLAAATATADRFVDAVNAAYTRLAEDRRSELVLLPTLIEMDAPPELLLQRADRAALMTPSSPAWSTAEAWATSDTQQAVLEALATITEETNPRRAMQFALPYGINGIPTGFIRAGVHAELGDPPTLASAQLGYMERLHWVKVLVDIETTRLVEAGDAEAAVNMNLDLAAFARQMAERQLGQEVEWAYETIASAMRRVRDAVYVDGKGARSLTSSFLVDTVAAIDVDRGLYRIDRLRMPTGDKQSALQLAERVFDRAGRPDQAVFPAVMAEMAATGRPLRLFGEAGRWAERVESHAGQSQTRQVVEGVYNDWNTRWNSDPYDPIQSQTSTFQRLESRSEDFSLITQAVPDLGRLLDLRKGVQAETVGTRVALASQALTLATGTKASSLALLRPRYVDDLGVDPFNPNTDLGNRPEFLYFVPERDDVSGNRHRMNVVPRLRSNFSVTLTRDDFVLYSPGGNGADDRAINVSDNPSAVIGDYLVWPPVISLTREHLRQTGASE
ncbi:MAG: hypothetical protein AAFO89_04050 [Planctomycetota bacterium]